MGCNSVIFSLTSLPDRSHILKERICSARRKFFPFFRVDLSFEGFRSPGQQRGSHQSCLPLRKIHINLNNLFTAAFQVHCKHGNSANLYSSTALWKHERIFGG